MGGEEEKGRDHQTPISRSLPAPLPLPHPASVSLSTPRPEETLQTAGRCATHRRRFNFLPRRGRRRLLPHGGRSALRAPRGSPGGGRAPARGSAGWMCCGVGWGGMCVGEKRRRGRVTAQPGARTPPEVWHNLSRPPPPPPFFFLFLLLLLPRLGAGGGGPAAVPTRVWRGGGGGGSWGGGSRCSAPSPGHGSALGIPADRKL